jgi:putative membrane protein
MVKELSLELKETIAKAIAEAGRRTSAEIVVVVLPASDPYQSYLLSYGLILGSLAGMGLWMEKMVTGFPLLFGVQVAAIMLTLFIPLLGNLCLKLIPKRVLHHHAARRAFEEFLIVSRHVPAERPVVLLYISLAERYVHILHSRAVLPKIPNETWEAVIQEFTTLMKKFGLQEACVTAIHSISSTLEPHFPEKH